jgi:hypothetical protein
MTTSWLRWPPWSDIPLAAGVYLLSLVELAVSGQDPFSVVSAVTVALMTLPVAFRQRAPLAAAIVIATWFPINYAIGGEHGTALTPLLAPLLVTYTLATHAPLRRAVAGIALLVASLELAVVLAGLADYGFGLRAFLEKRAPDFRGA